MESSTSAAEIASPGPYRAEGELPLVVLADDHPDVSDLCDWLTSRREWVEGRLVEHGAILFRGFDVKGAEDFERIARAIDDQLQNEYMGTSPRDALTPYVFSASELPGFYPIPQHTEMSFVAAPPRRLFFSCFVEPADGSGETPLVDFRRVYRDLDPEVRARFDERGLRIVRNYRGAAKQRPWQLGQLKGWEEMFGTTERAAVEEKCAREGFTPVWGEDGSLRLISTQPAARPHPVTGEEVWFNHSQVFHLSAGEGEYRRIARLRPSLRHFATWLVAASRGALSRRLSAPDERAMHCMYDDGSEISQADMEAVRDAIWKNLSITPWRRGDVLAIDNFSTAHGRLPYRGPREVVVAWA